MNRHLGRPEIFLETHHTQVSRRAERCILRFISHVSPEHKMFLFFTGLNNKDINIFQMASLQKNFK
jgi:hypothetical protein